MKPANLFMIFFLSVFFLRCYSQQGSAPENSAAKGSKMFFEKAYVFTDRSYYSAGDDIWYSAFLLDAQTNQLTSTSNNLYVELISPGAELIQRKVIRVNDGLGKGDFKLGDYIKPGKYRLRAYTNWMRNFEDKFFFEKEITVLGATANGTVSLIGETSAVLNFFPEGGSMVEGVLGIVAFKAEDSQGKSLSTEGNIETEAGTVITAFKTSFNGMGRFLLQPEAGKKYFAKGKYSSGKTFNMALPTVQATGYGLYVRQSDSIFTVNVKTNEQTLSMLTNKKILAVVKSKGKTYHALHIPMNSLHSAFLIPKNGLPTGISTLTIYDEKGRPSCERLLNVENRHVPILSVTSDKTFYGAKEKATLKIKTSANNSPVKSHLSLAVVDASLIPDDVQGNIVSYLNLQSELKGKIEDPGQYFNLKNEDRNSRLDLLLLCSGWRDFLWKRLAEAPLNITFNAEKGITVAGRVEQKFKEKGLADANITLSAFSARGDKIFMTQSDPDGKFYVDGVNLYGYQPVKITSVNSKAQKQGYLYLDTAANNSYPAILKYPAFSDSTGHSKMIREIERRNQVLGNHRLSDTIALNEVVVKSGGKSLVFRDVILNDFGYKEDEFTIQPSDHDYRDLRHFLTHRLNYNTSIVNPGIRLDSTGEANYTPTFPRLIVNGRQMPYTDEDPPQLIQDYIDVYYGLRMDKVKHIKAKRMVGMDQNTGRSREVFVLYLTVDMSAIRGEEAGVISREVQGYYESRVFYEPRYSGPISRPDVRTTIHWQPLVTTNENGEAVITYYNADPKSRIKIVAEGITVNGVPIAGFADYEVR